MKKIATIILVCLPALYTSAQTTNDSIKTVVNNLFIAMKNSDGNAVKNCLQMEQSYKLLLRTKK